MRQKRASGQIIAAVAGVQHGVVSTQQLLATGLSLSGISRRVRDGRLHRMHQGVYAVGHAAPSLERGWMAAVIACGRDASEAATAVDRTWLASGVVDDPGTAVAAGEADTILGRWGAALSHRSAAHLWQLLPVRDGPIDVSIPGYGGKRGRRGIRLHRSLSLLPAVVTLCSGIPVTTPARTIADLRRVASAPGKQGLISPWELRRAIRQANVRGLPIDEQADRDRTRSDLERDFLRLCRRHDLPPPEVNVRIGPHLVDFLWRDRWLVVETDGYDYHRGRVAFEDDRARDLDLRARGYEVLRLSGKQVDDEAQRVAEVVSAALRVRAHG